MVVDILKTLFLLCIYKYSVNKLLKMYSFSVFTTRNEMYKKVYEST